MRGGVGLDVIQKLKEKDETALRLLMEQYGDYLLRTAFLLLKDYHAAEEAVQDTFIQGFEKINQLRDADKLKSWLTRIVINQCRMKQRTWSWKAIFPFDRVERIVDQDGGVEPESEFLIEWRNEQLSSAIHRLGYINREVITLYYFNELNVQEITEHLQSNENTIKARLVRGRKQLKEILGEEGSEHG